MIPFTIYVGETLYNYLQGDTINIDGTTYRITQEEIFSTSVSYTISTVLDPAVIKKSVAVVPKNFETMKNFKEYHEKVLSGKGQSYHKPVNRHFIRIRNRI